MNLHIIDCGNFMADGGALFGVIPKTMWQKRYPANENNLCNLKMRSLLVETGDRKILIDTGIGTKQDPNTYKYYYLNGEGELIKSLKEAGFSPEDITDVVHTHLHFDHCGGSLKKDSDGNIVPTFPNANLWVTKKQWDWAQKPNKREAPAYPSENILPMKDSGKLKFLEEGELYPGFSIVIANGHTPGQALPLIEYKGKKLLYCGDLIPTMANVPTSFISAYDLFQLEVLDEKEKILNEAVENNYTLFFEHDLYNECCLVTNTKKGIIENKIFTLKEFLKQED